MKKDVTKKYVTVAVAGLVGLSLSVPTVLMATEGKEAVEAVKTEKVETPAKAAESKVGLESYESKISYSMGYEMGSYLKSIGAEITQEDLLTGVKDAFSEGKPLLTSEEMNKVKQEFAKRMQEKQKQKIEEMKAKNLADGNAYLEKNKGKEGVIVTKSGLQYTVVEEGKGDKATAEDTVSVKYKGTLIDGTEFDSTDKQGGKPAEFKVNQVISGWTEALQLMNPGTKLHLVVPANLAYGEQGAAPVIQPNSVLVFDVELLEIKKADDKVEEAKDVEQKKLSGEEPQKAAEQVKPVDDKVEATSEQVKTTADKAVKE